MQVQPYLYFNGRCEEALEFYEKALGAKVEMQMRFSESPVPMDKSMVPPGSDNKIMHASIKVGESVVLASDGHCAEDKGFSNFGLSLVTKDAAEAEKMFKALSDGGNPIMPLTETFFSPKFGMIADKFGVVWLVIAEGQPPKKSA